MDAGESLVALASPATPVQQTLLQADGEEAKERLQQGSDSAAVSSAGSSDRLQRLAAGLDIAGSLPIA